MQISSELAGNLASAEERNRFVLKHADEIWLPHVTPGGMLDQLVADLRGHRKRLGVSP